MLLSPFRWAAVPAFTPGQSLQSHTLLLFPCHPYIVFDPGSPHWSQLPPVGWCPDQALACLHPQGTSWCHWHRAAPVLLAGDLGQTPLKSQGKPHQYPPHRKLKPSGWEITNVKFHLNLFCTFSGDPYRKCLFLLPWFSCFPSRAIKIQIHFNQN